MALGLDRSAAHLEAAIYERGGMERMPAGVAEADLAAVRCPARNRVLVGAAREEDASDERGHSVSHSERGRARVAAWLGLLGCSLAGLACGREREMGHTGRRRKQAAG